MQALVEAIRERGMILPGGMLKVDGLINHQLLPQLTREMGERFAAGFAPLNPNKVVTIEVSGIAPALATALALNVPLVYARKKKPITMQEPTFTAQSISRTKGGAVDLFVSSEYLGSGDRVVVIDDFLASGGTLRALAGIIALSGAELLGLGCVIEKGFEEGRAKLADLGVPILTLANILRMNEQEGIVVEAGLQDLPKQPAG
ncbi:MULTISPECIES: xanthine phosphoribosyltransferase [Deinococcus]|uniref:Xanthine phosphoribosyltransferase n=1 Tax=Deinococcus geothermalis (strain DSM 11300 / CIP 105573 / AG-3a) TaxID=319795 RepID=XPT_DEIGD|nr:MULTISPECIES: xanthine phosphoribosyltransferase [Deinococcus]Q1J141.1 RecName: Full=Xanthine phosphoribosyltransferase; Short=XPRTase [Deinococcus geothermalis DSM 11300]ABF44793.1 xanthine phosphoribosyltransferase [Deinococcus geothermalis DSM 11300]MBI0446834.1 xanthine phosphoribosyltransferase [Deinococcus sp. DB0503]TDE87079.1 xanthine phosphoribosyltransferase [Deinococcus sp. S9]